MTKTKRKGLSRKERMAMAQTTAGISFGVDLRKDVSADTPFRSE